MVTSLGCKGVGLGLGLGLGVKFGMYDALKQIMCYAS